MGLVGGFTEVNGRQEGENKCLKKCHEQFEAVHENHKGSGKDANAKSSSQGVTFFSKDDDQADERQDDDVACTDVRCQTNHQHDGLEEHAHDFNGDDDGHDKQGHSGRPKEVAPIMLVPIEIRQQKHQCRQYHSHANGTSDIKSSKEWNQAEEVAEEYEEEYSK